MDLRGAKSNVMSLIGTYRNRNCPLVALFGRWPFESFGVYEDHQGEHNVESQQRSFQM